MNFLFFIDNKTISYLIHKICTHTHKLILYNTDTVYNCHAIIFKFSQYHIKLENYFIKIIYSENEKNEKFVFLLTTKIKFLSSTQNIFQHSQFDIIYS